MGITDTQIQPENYRRLGKEYGIFLTEILDIEKYRISQDSEIEPHHVNDGMEKLISRIEDYDPNRIAFVGKNAATWIYRHLENREITDSSASPHKDDRKSLDYGPLDWEYLGLNYYLLTSTRPEQYSKEIWEQFWEICREDVKRFRRSQA